jgi:CPA2 family monovalent cation:H+ antiporter-2
MGDAWLFMLDMVIVLGGAAVLGILCERLRLGSVIGYLLAGVIIGPGVIGFVSTGDVIEVIAEVGVALLLFTIGLEFSWKQLVRFGGRAIVGGAIAVVSVILVSILVSLSFGADWRTGFVVGAAASLGSTAIVLRILRDKSDLDSVHGRFAVAILLTQDIAIIPLVLVVSFLSMRSENLAESLGQALVNTLAFVVGLVLFVSLAIPRLLNENVIARNREIPILIAFSTAVGATWAAHSLGLSPALGAFFAGLLLAEGRFADQMRADVLPLRTLFITVFFVSVGLLADVRWMAENALLVLGTTLTLVFGKTVVTYLSIRPFQPSIVACMATAIAISQVGEFSFLLLAVASEGGLLSTGLFKLATSVVLLTLFATPFLTGNSRRIALRIVKVFVPKRKLAKAERSASSRQGRQGHVIIVGYGAAGSATAFLLRDSDVHVTVMEIHPGLVREAETCGLDAMVGDGTQGTILEHANIEAAKAVVVAVPDTQVARAIVSQCKHLAPDVPVFARSRYHIFADQLNIVGADVVVDEEQSVGELLGRHVVAFLRVPREIDKGHSER